MANKDTILADINRAFGNFPRPQAMVRNPNHCDECADHESVMQAVTPQNVSLIEVGSPAWDPVCYLTDEAFGYFMPGLVRLALDENEYLDQLFFHVENRYSALNASQCRAILQVMDYIGDAMLADIINFSLESDWDRIRDQLIAACQE